MKKKLSTLLASAMLLGAFAGCGDTFVEANFSR